MSTQSGSKYRAGGRPRPCQREVSARPSVCRPITGSDGYRACGCRHGYRSRLRAYEWPRRLFLTATREQELRSGLLVCVLRVDAGCRPSPSAFSRCRRCMPRRHKSRFAIVVGDSTTTGQRAFKCLPAALGRSADAAYPRPMSFVSRVRSAYRKLPGRPPYDPKKLHDAKKRDPKYHYSYTGKHLDADRDFKKPKP